MDSQRLVQMVDVLMTNRIGPARDTFDVHKPASHD